MPAGNVTPLWPPNSAGVNQEIHTFRRHLRLWLNQPIGLQPRQHVIGFVKSLNDAIYTRKRSLDQDGAGLSKLAGDSSDRYPP